MVISGLLLVISLYGAYTLTIFSKYFSSVFSILSFAFRVDVYFSSFLLIVIFAFSFCVHTYYGFICISRIDILSFSFHTLCIW